MSHQRLFRFGVQARRTGTRHEWIHLLRQSEDLGYSTLSVLDHFVRGFDPMAALGAAAMATKTLRLGTLVIDTDFRHPAVLAKGLATIDVLSEGRLEIGLGAGWLRDEYVQTGIPFDPPGVRIERMTETVRFIRQVFAEDTTTFSGRFISTTELTLPPKPVQRPCPPILIGGGGKRVLGVAAAHADIVGLTSRSLPDGSKVPGDMTACAVGEKVGWIKDAAGPRFADLELTIFINQLHFTDDQASLAADLAVKLGISQEEVLTSPHILIGTVDEMVSQLEQRRETFGISYYVVEEGNLDRFAPLVERLAGQ
jgi:probable F420-dependent oxidoreductase